MYVMSDCVCVYATYLLVSVLPVGSVSHAERRDGENCDSAHQGQRESHQRPGTPLTTPHLLGGDKKKKKNVAARAPRKLVFLPTFAVSLMRHKSGDPLHELCSLDWKLHLSKAQKWQESMH